MNSKKPNPSLTPHPRPRPLTSLEKALLRQPPLPSQSPSRISSTKPLRPSTSPRTPSNLPAQGVPSQSPSPNFLEKLLLRHSSLNGNSPSDTAKTHGSSPEDLQPPTSNHPRKSPKTSPKDSRATSRPSSNSDLTQALLALRDLVEVLPLSADPYLVSAYQEARVVLRKHEVEINGTVRT